MVSILSAAEIAEAAYTPGKTVEGYTFVSVSSSGGHSASVYKNENTGQFVIGIAGTSAEAGDILNDAALTTGFSILGTGYDHHVNGLVDSLDVRNIVLTGHSLGGVISQSVSGNPNVSEVYAFNAPGLGGTAGTLFEAVWGPAISNKVQLVFSEKWYTAALIHFLVVHKSNLIPIIVADTTGHSIDGLISALSNDNECFPAGTSIKLASGETVSIEDIAIADQIATVHNSSQEIGIDAPLNSGTVSRLYTNVSEDYVELNFIDPATGKQSTLTATPGHVFLDENGKWQQIGDMIANANDANNVAPFTGPNTGSKIAETTIAPKLNATILSLNTAANDNYPGHVTTNLKTTDRILRRSGAKCIGGGYVV